MATKKIMIYLRVVAVRDLAFSHTSNTFCKLTVGKEHPKKIKTEIVQRTGKETTWTEKGRLLEVSDEEVVCSVFDYVSIFPDKTIGLVTIKFSDYADGVPHDEWFKLLSKKGKEIGGELRLQIMQADPDRDVSVTEADFTCKLHHLILKEKMEVFHKLLAVSGNKEIGVLDPAKDTPLHVACQSNHVEAVAALVKAGADVNAENDLGFTPVHLAAGHSPKSLSVLVSEGKVNLDINKGILQSQSASETDEKGLTPMHMAAVHNQPISVEILTDKGANPNRQTEKGNTPLHLAMRFSANDAIRALVQKAKSDLFVENKEEKSVAKYAIALGGEVKSVFKEAASVEDDREFDILKTEFKSRHRAAGDHIDFEWKKSQQFCLTVREKTPVFMLIHFIGGSLAAKEKDKEQFVSKVGFVVMKTKEGIHQELSYQTEFVGYGGQKPFEGDLLPDTRYVVIPYTQELVAKGKYSLLVFTKPNHHVDFSPLVPWQYSASCESEWRGTAAAGCQNNKQWKNNPQFLLELPKDKENVNIYVLVSQRKLEVDLIPYQVLPYPVFIGFYLYDADVDEKLGESEKWKNAREVYTHFKLSTKTRNRFVLIPATFEANQETTFTISVFSDDQVFLKLKPKQ